jgi:hypothetical protein
MRSGAGTGSRSSARKKKGLIRRAGIIFPAVGIAVLIVVVVAAASYLMNPAGSGANSVTGFLGALPQSKSVALLETERQNLITMNDAAQTMSQGAKPAKVAPLQVIASAQAQAAASASAAASSSSSGSGSGTTTQVAQAPAPDPGSAQATAKALMVQSPWNFTGSSQYSCLYSLWMQESSWRYDAYNPSGAYGIPQALPGSKMASAGSDWQTNPRTQIIWGLGYIQSIYGTPCGAWSHEQADGWY